MILLAGRKVEVSAKTNNLGVCGKYPNILTSARETLILSTTSPKHIQATEAAFW